MVHRLMAGLGAVGVDRVVMMPAGSGVSQSLAAPPQRPHRAPGRPAPARARGAGDGRCARTPATRPRPSRPWPSGGWRRSWSWAATAPTGWWRGHCGDIPLCALSTGTNNAFPELREATVAGLATGLVATGRLGGDGLVRRAKQLEVAVEDGHPRQRAGRRGRHRRALGRVAGPVAGRVDLGGAGDLRQPRRGRPLGGGGGGRAGAEGGPVRAPPAPGPARRGAAGRHRPARPRPDRRGRGARGHAASSPARSWRSPPGPAAWPSTGNGRSSSAQDDRVTVRLGQGPLVVDVDAVMAAASQHQLLHQATTRRADDGNHRPTGPGHQGAAPGLVPDHAHDPRVRGAAARRVRHRRHPGIRPPLRGRGGDRGRRLRAPETTTTTSPAPTAATDTRSRRAAT